VLEPVALGLKFAGMLSGGSFLQGDFTAKLQAAGVDATAYAAALPGGHVAVVILNKDAAQDLKLTIDFGADKRGPVRTETLHAPALDSREAHITRSPESGHLQHGRYAVTVPHASGVCLTTQ
jgi:hypothetical protein